MLRLLQRVFVPWMLRPHCGASLGAFLCAASSVLSANGADTTSGELCRVSEKCYALSAEIVGPDASLPRVAGIWPYPNSNDIKTKVGDRLHFAWESRNEFYDPNNEWKKHETAIHSQWESDPAPDACTGQMKGDWLAKSTLGEKDIEIQPCQAGRNYVITLTAEAMGPKAVAKIEIHVAGTAVAVPASPPGSPWAEKITKSSVTPPQPVPQRVPAAAPPPVVIKKPAQSDKLSSQPTQPTSPPQAVSPATDIDALNALDAATNLPQK